MHTRTLYRWFNILILLVLLFAPLSPAVPTRASAPPASPNPDFAPDRLLARLQDGLALEQAALDSSGVLSAQPLFRGQSLPSALAQIVLLELPPGSDVQALTESLSKDTRFAWVEPDYLAAGSLSPSPFSQKMGSGQGWGLLTTPNDPLFPDQWGLTRIEAPAAWDIQTGSETVVIAIVDSGIERTHPDLQERMWVNPGEVAGNGLDDDNNGFIDDVHGWDFVSEDNDPLDDNGHGTQVAGVAVASTNNSAGIAGTCWGCRLMAVKVMSAGGVANYSDIAQGVLYAAQKGAKVINLSLGGYSFSNALQEAVQTAVNDYGAVVVAGAGNDNTDNPFYPAAYDEAIAVAGTDQNDLKASFSDYGTWVDLSAPAVAIHTAFSGGDYGPVDGTSMAAPFASGLAGLLLSEYTDWSGVLVRAQMIHTADSLDALNPGYEGLLGSGRVNAAEALTVTPHPLFEISEKKVNGDPLGRPTPGESATLEITLSNDWLDAQSVQGVLTTSDPYVTLTQDTAAFGDLPAGGSGTGMPAYTFDVASGAGYDHPIDFTLELSAYGGYSTTLNFTIQTQSAEQQVWGTIDVDTIWTNDKTYIVMGNLGVAPGVTLTVEAGTDVLFNGDYSLNVGGQLIADGTQAQPIRFLSNTGDSWGRIYFDDTSIDATADLSGTYQSGNLLRWVIVEGASQGIGCNNATPYLSHLTTDNGGTNCTLGATPLWLQDSDLTGNVTVIANPLVGAYDTPGEAWSVSVSGGYAYVADRGSGLRILDVSNPANPFEIGAYDTPDQAYDVAISGDIAYVADGSALRVVDVSNPANPIEIGFNNTLGFAVSVVISGTYAYVAAWYDGLRVVDVSDPANPTEVGFYDTPEIAYNLAISGGYAYVADEASGLRVVDVSDPANPTEAGSYDTPGYAFGVAISDGYAYVADGGGMLVVDISDPANLIEIGSYNTPGEALDVTISGSYAYVADNMGGLRIVDVSLPFMPIEVGFYSTSGNTVGVYVTNEYAYVADYTIGLSIYPAYGVTNAALLNTTLRGGDLNLPQSSLVLASTIDGSISAGSGSTVEDSTTGSGITIHGDGTVENVAVSGGGIFIRSGQVLSNTLSGGIRTGDGSLVQGNSIEDSYIGIQITGTATIIQNRLVGNASGIQASRGLIQGNLVANSTGVGLEINGDVSVISNTFTANLSNTIVILTGTPTIQGNNLEGNTGTYDIRNQTINDIQAQDNWWGTTEAFAISQRIYDYDDDYTLGEVVYQPFDTGPVQTAPAYVRSVTLNPESPVGIETVNFEVEFSKPMDMEILPQLSFQSPQNNTWTVYNTANSELPYDWVRAITSDPDGSYWFGTWGGGVANFDGTTWKVYNTSNSGLPNDDVRAIASDPDGSVWFGTDLGGVAHYDGVNWSVYNTSNSGLPSDSVYAITNDADGSLWFGTWNGVANFNGSTWTLYNTSNSGLPSDQIFAIANDADGSHWFGTAGGGVAHFDGVTWTVYNSSNSGLPYDLVYTITNDEDGSHWFGTWFGVAHFDGTTWTAYHTGNSGLPENEVHAIIRDMDGSHWFGTSGGGVAHFDGVTWTVYNSSNSGLPDNTVPAIALDQNGSHWFGTGFGGVGVYWSKPISVIQDNPQWLDDTHFQASFDITSLIERGDYRITVADAAGSDGMQIAPNTAFTFTVDYAGGVGDTTPPGLPIVTACAGATLDSLSASWTASDPDSQITLYQYAIGTTPGASDVINWTFTDQTGFDLSGLSLVPGQLYYISVKARNAGGLWSEAATPEGVLPGSGICTTNSFLAYLSLVSK